MGMQKITLKYRLVTLTDVFYDLVLGFWDKCDRSVSKLSAQESIWV
jgi:hypothetical protein